MAERFLAGPSPPTPTKNVDLGSPFASPAGGERLTADQERAGPLEAFIGGHDALALCSQHQRRPAACMDRTENGREPDDDFLPRAEFLAKSASHSLALHSPARLEPTD